MLYTLQVNRKKPTWFDGELHVGKCGKKCVVVDEKGARVKTIMYLRKHERLYEGAEIMTPILKFVLQRQLLGDEYEESLERAKDFPVESQVDFDEKFTTGVGGSRTFTQPRFMSRSNPSRYHPFQFHGNRTLNRPYLYFNIFRHSQ